MKRFLPLLITLLLVGCEESPITEKMEVTPKVAQPTNQVEKVEQFTVTSKGTFKAGYNNEVREILIVKDNKTGIEYLTITDCSMIRRVKAKKEAQEQAVNAAADIISALGDAD